MKKQISSSLRENLLYTLKEKPFQTGTELLDSVYQHSRHRFTKQALYKELRRLRLEQSLVTIRKQFALSTTYLEGEQAQIVRARRKLLDSSELFLENQPLKLKFQSLLEMKPVWSHFVLALLRQTKAKSLCSWNPHPWFYLVQLSHEEQLLEGLQNMNAHMYKIIGGRTYLDKETHQLLQEKGHSSSIAKSPFESMRSTYLSIIDDWIIEVRLPLAAVGKIGEFYQKIQRQSQVSLPEAIGLFAAPHGIKLVVSKNRTKALKFRQQFSKFFGVSIC